MVLNLQFIYNKVMPVCFGHTNPPSSYFIDTHMHVQWSFIYILTYQVDFMATFIPVLYKSHTNVRPNTLNN